MRTVHQLSILCVILSAAGCQRQTPVIARVTVTWPTASAVEMDEQVAFPLISSTNGVPGLADVRALSYAGRTEVYLTLEQRDSLPQINKRVNQVLPSLPSGCSLEKIDSLGAEEDIPPPEKGEEQTLVIHLKSDETLAQLGVSANDVTEQIQKLQAAGVISDENLDEVKSSRITVGGRDVPLEEVVELSVATQPKCVVRDLMGRH